VPPDVDAMRIGRPVDNTRAYVVDRHLRPVPVGVPGELLLGEVEPAAGGLARGYLGRAALTAERWVPDPFAATGGRLYRTGDRARWRDDATLDFLGRLDHQVKLRGFRIELGEVEATLRRRPGVREAAVAVRDGSLVAWVAADPLSPPDAEDLRAGTAASLPDYMVPASVVFLDALPRTPNGKVDRAALPDPRRTGRGLRPPRDGLELALVHVFERVLGVEGVGLEDDFFALGGHSLLALRLVSEIERTVGFELPVSELFRSPTPARLAQRARLSGSRAESSVLVPLRDAAEGEGDVVPWFLIHPAGGSVFGYHDLVRHLPAAVWGLQSAALEGGEPEQDADLRQVARRYVEKVRRVRPAGPYRVAGWSLGGVVAFEMTRLLRACGEEVRLVLLDPSPVGAAADAMPTSEEPLIELAYHLGIDEADLPRFAAALPPSGATDGDDGGLDAAAWRRLAATAEELGAWPPGLPPSHLAHRFRVFKVHLEALRSYRPQPLDVSALLVRAQDGDVDTAAPWHALLLGGATVLAVAGTHYTFLHGEGAKHLAAQILAEEAP
jgi:thioesterase domain-containing protein/acyl carrier protein